MAAAGSVEICGKRFPIAIRSTSASASVPMAKYAPRRRKAASPTATPAAVASAVPAAIAPGIAKPPVHRCRVTRAPIPKKAACPRFTWPANPPITFQLWASATRRKKTTPRLSQSSRATTTGASPRRARTIAVAAARATPTRRRAELIGQSSAPDQSGTGALTASGRRCRVGSRAPEQALRTRHQGTEEEQEADHLAVGAAERDGAQRLGAAEDHAADEGAERRAEPRQHDHDQRLERPLQADRRADRVAEAHQRPAGAAR